MKTLIITQLEKGFIVSPLLEGESVEIDLAAARACFRIHSGYSGDSLEEAVVGFFEEKETSSETD